MFSYVGILQQYRKYPNKTRTLRITPSENPNTAPSI